MMTYTQKIEARQSKEDSIAKNMEPFKVGKKVVITAKAYRKNVAIAEVKRTTKTMVIVTVLGNPEKGLELKYKVSEYNSIKLAGHSDYMRGNKWYSYSSISILTKTNLITLQKEIDEAISKAAATQANKEKIEKQKARAESKAFEDKVNGFWNYKGKDIWENMLCSNKEDIKDNCEYFFESKFQDHRGCFHKATILYSHREDKYAWRESKEDAKPLVHTMRVAGFKKESDNSWRSFSSSELSYQTIEECIYRLIH